MLTAMIRTSVAGKVIFLKRIFVAVGAGISMIFFNNTPQFKALPLFVSLSML
jgi:hypothetical protein